MTAFSDVMDSLHEAEQGARLWDGERLRAAAKRLSDLAAKFPPETCGDCGHDLYFHADVPGWFHVEDASQRPKCKYGDGIVLKRDT